MQLLDLPDEILATIFKELSTVKELLDLETTCKIFRNVIRTEEVWRARIKKDYSLLSYVSNKSPVFRRRNFRKLYRALRQPEVFVWGSFDNGRLGIPFEILDRSRDLNNEVYTPYLLKTLSNLGVASIVCGGYMMIALTHDNKVYYWGTFDGGVYFTPYSHYQETPTQLNIFPQGSNIHQITAGRSHALALSGDGKVFQFNNPEYPASEIVWDGIESPITQIACGFSHNLALTADHQVLWWNYRLRSRPTAYKKLLLPSDVSDTEYIVKVVGGDRFTLGLTNLGKVFWWLQRVDLDESYITMSEPPSILTLGPQPAMYGSLLLEVSHLEIGHITAQFMNFGLFDITGKLVLGRCEINNSGEEDEYPSWIILDSAIPKEEDTGLPIQVSFGDWHTGMVLDNGHIYTWGKQGLGHGSSQEIESPKRITHFTENYFVFYLACAGWHTAALAVNLNPDSTNSLPPHELDTPSNPEEIVNRVRMDMVPNLGEFGHSLIPHPE